MLWATIIFFLRLYCSLSTTSQPSIYFSRITIVMVGPSQYNTRGKDSWSLSLHSGSHQQTAYESLPNYSCRNVLQTTLFSVRHLLFSFCRWYWGPDLGPPILLGLFTVIPFFLVCCTSFMIMSICYYVRTNHIQLLHYTYI